MNTNEKAHHKQAFKQGLTAFSSELEKVISTGNGEWSVKGFIDIYKNVYTISSDTKIISKILEIHIFPHLLRFAEEIGYKILLAPHQNYYPDITFVHKKHDEVKFAVDIKTTYRKENGLCAFTLGSHGAYFKERDKSKNILFPYNHYLGHFCLGIVYSRIIAASDVQAETRVYRIQDLQSISSVIGNFDFFAAEKWKIAGDKQGSGNTANIGTMLSIEDLRAENGMFSQLGEEWFDEYWINFGSATMIKDGRTVKITSLKDFLEFKGRTDLWEMIVPKSARKEQL
ncbi:MAG: EcoRV family type II restriction endonuclease [Candidatus Kapabacteria bacterium]|jgi:hypothetical protein|nr:EcoRV family type II restriction endonuclease [Candidatus Kapabacteria bacterium]